MAPIRPKKIKTSQTNVNCDLNASDSEKSDAGSTFQMKRTSDDFNKMVKKRPFEFSENGGEGNETVNSLLKLFDNVSQDKLKKLDNLLISSPRNKLKLKKVLTQQHLERHEIITILTDNINLVIKSSEEENSKAKAKLEADEKKLIEFKSMIQDFNKKWKIMEKDFAKQQDELEKSISESIQKLSEQLFNCKRESFESFKRSLVMELND